MNLRELFHSDCDRLITFLESELAEARKERDYFKGRADRIELMLFPHVQPRERPIRTGVPTTVGPKTWEQTLAEHERMQAAEEAKKNGTKVREQGNAKDVRTEPRARTTQTV